jgi:hypothetical protein
VAIRRLVGTQQPIVAPSLTTVGDVAVGGDLSVVGAITAASSNVDSDALNLATKYTLALLNRAHMLVDTSVSALVALGGGALQAAANAQANAIKAACLAHAASVGTATADGGHLAADVALAATLNAIPAATEINSCIALVTGIKTFQTAHATSAGVHFNDDAALAAAVITAVPPVTLANCITDLNDELAALQAHFALGSVSGYGAALAAVQGRRVLTSATTAAILAASPGPSVDLVTTYVDEFDAVYRWHLGDATAADGYRVLSHTGGAAGRWILVGDHITLFPSGASDSTAIQGVLDALDAAGGGVLQLAPGVFLIDRAHSAGSNTAIRGAGRGITIVRNTEAQNLPISTGGTYSYGDFSFVAQSYVSVESLTIDHQTNGTNANGIVFVPDGNLRTITADPTTEKIHLVNHGMADGFGPLTFFNTGGALPGGMTAGVDYWWINVDADNGKLSDTQAHALAGTNVVDITSAGTGTTQISAPYTGTPCSYVTVRDVEVLGVAAYHQYSIWSARGQHVKFVDNFGDGGWTGGAGDTDSNGIEAYGGYDVLIRGNTLTRWSGQGVFVGAVEGYVDGEAVDFNVLDNSITGCRKGIDAQPAIGCAYLGGSIPQNISNWRIAGNIVRDSAEHGIRLYAPQAGTTIKNVRIEDNIVDDADLPIEVRTYAGDTLHSGNVVARNTISLVGSATGGGVNVYYMPGLLVEANEIVDSAGLGILLRSANQLRVVGNTVDGAVSNGVNADDCDDLVVARNLIRDAATGSLSIAITNSTRGAVNDNTFDRASTSVTEVEIASTCSHFEMRRNRTLYTSTSISPLFVNSGTYPKNKSTIASRFQSYVAIPAVATTGIHAAYAGNNATNLLPGPITQPTIPRGLAFGFGAAWDGGNITVVGIDPFGNAATEVVVANPGSNRQTAKVYASITSMTKGAVGASADAVTCGPGSMIGIAERATNSGGLCVVYHFVANVPTIVQASINAANDGWTCASTNPNGDNWMIEYPVSDNG